MKIPFLQTSAVTALMFCTVLGSKAQLKFDFESGGPPPDTTLFGSARLDDDGSGLNRCLRLTDPFNSSFGQFQVSNIGEGKSVKAIDIQWRSRIGGGTGGGADGYSLNWADDLPETPDYAFPGEEGIGSGLTVTVDTFDNGGGETGIDLRWKSNVVASAPIPKDDAGGGTFLRRNQFVDAQLSVDNKGLASFTYDGITITAMLDGYKGLKGGSIMLGARTGGANDNHWIDDLQITTGVFSAGVFNGLFYESDVVRHEHSGFFTMKLTSKGTFSGYLLLGGARHGFKGAFDTDTLSTKIEFPRPGSTTLTVELKLTDKDTIQGTVTDGIWVAGLEADRQVWNKKTRTADSYEGKYTIILDASLGVSVPNGYGYGILTVSSVGAVKFAGVLGDGSKASQKATVSKSGAWPLYIAAYKGQGSVLGWVPLSNIGVSNERVTWTKKPSVPGPLYPSGFVLTPRFYVGPYSPPPKGTRILNIGTDQVEFGGSEFAAPFASEFALTAENKIVDLSDNRLKLSFTTKTGLFKGSIVEPGSGAKIKFAGVVFQPEDVAAGLFLGPTRSSPVIIND